jgi:hypothetical protein
MDLLAAAGFGRYSPDSNILTSSVSAPISPVSSRSSTWSDSTSGSRVDALTIQDEGSLHIPPEQHSSQKESDPSTSQEPEKVTRLSQIRSKSHSPTSGEVRALPSDLACVGLSDDNVDNWALKIVKLVAFPELIIPAHSSTAAATAELFLDNLPGRGEATLESVSPIVSRGRTFSSSVSTSSSCSDDGYFSHSPLGNHSSSSLVTSAASRSCMDLPTSTPTTPFSGKPASKHRMTTLPPLNPGNVPKKDDSEDLHPTQPLHVSPVRSWKASGSARVPFFSFTRTTEGSSLTTEVLLLAALFPPHERYMVSCSGELDEADRRDTNAVESDDENDDGEQGPLRCLQIDLRRFGLGE